MIGRTLIAFALLGSVPAYGQDEPAPTQAKIRNMAEYLEAVVDPRRGIYIRGYTGQWYYASVRGECPRLNPVSRLRFEPSPGGDFDRNSTIRADGWRCFVDSVVESEGPPRRNHG